MAELLSAFLMPAVCHKNISLVSVSLQVLTIALYMLLHWLVLTMLHSSRTQEEHGVIPHQNLQ